MMFTAPRHFLTSVCFSAGFYALAAFSETAQAAPPVGYRLAWQDEFDGTVLDAAKWMCLKTIRSLL